MASNELKPYKPEARIMQTLASLAARKPLMELDALLEGRDRVSAQQVSFMLRGVGSAMSDYAFTLRQDFDAMRQRAEKAERDAERYRWLCDGNGYFLEEAGITGPKEMADKAIDEAMADRAAT